jgi:hypothetical protein
MMVSASPGIYAATPARFVGVVSDDEVKRRTLRGESQTQIARDLGISRAAVCSSRRRLKRQNEVPVPVKLGGRRRKYE